jgi:hypothetical protein
MKTIILCFIAIAVFLFQPKVSKGISLLTQTQLMQPIPVVYRVADDYDSTFRVQNYTDVNIGWINIHLSNDSYSYLNITSSGIYSTPLYYAPYECSIHGQTFVMNVPKTIYIDLHTSVVATWTGNVVVLNDEQVF